MRLKTRVVCLLLLCCVPALLTLVYFVAFGDDLQPTRRAAPALIIVPFSEVRANNASLLVAGLKRRLEAKMTSLESDQSLLPKLDALVASLRPAARLSALNQSVWALAASWVTARHVIPEETPLLDEVMSALRESRVLRADVSRKGTQLKVALTLEGGQEVLFKPMRYSRETIVAGLYSGFDRHNGEIVAFHLSRLLGLRSAPIVSSRVLHLNSQIKAVATPALLSTFLEGKPCFYGQCYYCNEMDAVCAQSDGKLEGAVILLLPHKYRLEKLRNPWQRTYRSGTNAIWESDADFCNAVLRRLPLRPRVLDLIDASIFDFLIGNADRHHYEVFKDVPNSALLLIDNGKSFGDPFSHELTILFPLYQCCSVRNSTYERLRLLSASKVSVAIETLLRDDLLWPLVTRPHLEALDERLRIIMAVIEVCFDSKSKQKVLK